MYLWLYEDFFAKHKIDAYTLSFQGISMETLVGKAFFEMAEQISAWDDHSFKETDWYSAVKNTEYHQFADDFIKKYELLFGMEEISLSIEKRNGLIKELSIYRFLRNNFEKEIKNTGTEIFKGAQEYYFKENGILLSETKLCEKMFLNEYYTAVNLRRRSMSRDIMFKVEMFILYDLTNVEFQRELLDKIDKWRDEHNDKSVYALQDTINREIIYKILHLWRKLHGETITVADLEKIRNERFNEYRNTKDKSFFKHNVNYQSDRYGKSWGVFEKFVLDNFEEFQNNKEIKALLKEIRHYKSITSGGTLPNHDPKFKSEGMKTFQTYYPIRFTMGLDLLTCQFLDLLGKEVRHHPNQNPEMLFMFTKDKNSPGGYRVELILIDKRVHGYRGITDGSKIIQLHGRSLFIKERNEIIKARMKHLIDLSIKTKGMSPKQCEAFLRKEFKNKQVTIQGTKGLFDVKLWGSIDKLGIEGLSKDNMDDFIQRWLKWNFDKVSEKEWFEDNGYKEFYEKWLQFKTEILRDMREYNKFDPEKLSQSEKELLESYFSYWFINVYLENEHFPDGFNPFSP